MSPPTITITAPLNNATYTAPLDDDHQDYACARHRRVDFEGRFYAGTTLLGTVTVSPYNLSWVNAGGRLRTHAKVTDSLGASRDIDGGQRHCQCWDDGQTARRLPVQRRLGHVGSSSMRPACAMGRQPGRLPP